MTRIGKRYHIKILPLVLTFSHQWQPIQIWIRSPDRNLSLLAIQIRFAATNKETIHPIAGMANLIVRQSSHVEVGNVGTEPVLDLQQGDGKRNELYCKMPSEL